jgi:hypothetical protein
MQKGTFPHICHDISNTMGRFAYDFLAEIHEHLETGYSSPC